MDFTIELAEMKIAISALYDTTKDYCKGYWTEGAADFFVTISPDDIIDERKRSARQDARDGIPTRQFSDSYMEILAVYRKIAEQMIWHDTLLFHGSVVAVDGVGYMFTALSGTGKSTHTRLWREYFGDRAVMVNDDKPLLEVTENGVLACGTPWSGKHRINTKINVPLKAICILEQGEKNSIVPVTAMEAMPILLEQSHRPADRMGLIRYLDLIEQIVSKVGLYRLRCNMEPEAAIVSYYGMRGKEIE
ncbi:MAG: hypothetical protein IJ422_03655 [Oscillospiraceae bacterium]|nr:hypothetical protein [Oscillospiraceae bacterium]